MKRLLAAALAALVAACAGTGPEPAEPMPSAVVEVAPDRTVRVEVSCPDGAVQGSGVVVTNDFVLTAKHLLDDDCAYLLYDRKGQSLGLAVEVGVDPNADVALLGLVKPLPGEVPEPCMRYEELGEHITAVGYPGGVYTVTYGKALPPRDGERQVSAPIKPGSSGGGAWAADGCLVGLTVAYWTDGGTVLAP